MKAKQKKTVNLMSFHRKLILRLAIFGLIIALLGGFAAWMKERHRVGESIVVRAVIGASAFNIYIADLIEEPGWPDKQVVQHALEQFTSRRLDNPNGEFVSVKVYDEESGSIAKLSMKDYAHINAVNGFLKDSPFRFPNAGNETTEVFWLDRIPHIKIAVPLTDAGGDPVAYVEGVFAVSQEALNSVRRRAMEIVLWVFAIIFGTTVLFLPTIIMLTRRLRILTLNLLESNLETLNVLGSAIAKRDSDTDAHNYRVTLYAVRLAEALDMDRQAIQSLIKGAFLHDVGKIGVKDNILLKPGRLDEKEFDIMKTHVSHGLDIVKRSDWLKDAIDVVGHHHEKYDGSGYGDGLNAEAIPFAARIFAVADVFDALVSRRPYKEPLSFDETMEILKDARGTHFAPDILDAFTKIAEPLYKEFAGREDDGLKDQLREITQRYFTKDAEINI